MNEATERDAKFLQTIARKGARLGHCGRLCGDCAFKPQEDKNYYPETIQVAIDALLSGAQFNCHTKDYQDAGRPCVGWQYARQYFEHLEGPAEPVVFPETINLLSHAQDVGHTS